MSKRVSKKPVALAIGAALATSIAAAGVAQASSFAVNALGAGYMLAAGDAAGEEGKPADCEGQCGEGKCGEGKCGEGKCGQGKCKDENKEGEPKEETAPPSGG
jgi:uncharacterized low-complexity protein